MNGKNNLYITVTTIGVIRSTKCVPFVHVYQLLIMCIK